MRIALLPLDSRPPNWQFPQRLAALAGVELVLPPREWLGTLHAPARQAELLAWLARTAPECDAAVFAWDALIYGGLVQSRRMDPAGPQAGAAAEALTGIPAALAAVDWSRCAGYALATVPRLGLSVTDRDSHSVHLLVREYLIASGAPATDSRARATAERLAAELGEDTVRLIWRWRERNAGICSGLLDLSCALGLRQLHFAVEDNAPTGPHLAEAAALRKQALALRREHPGTHVTLFDGTDEALCLLLARAVLDLRRAAPLPVQLLLHPRVPGPDQYTGLYESQTLGAGIEFLARQLGLEYVPQADLRWAVCYGVQPQPDVFAADAERVFSSPFLLPKALEAGGPLLLTDLCACNGANRHLAVRLAGLLGAEGQPLRGLCGFNTNFNALGVSAAWLALAGPSASAAADASTRSPAETAFALERLADDLVYQSIARPRVVKYLRQRRCDPLDFSPAPEQVRTECVRLVQRCWADWCGGQGAPVLAASRIEPRQAAGVRFSFPWQRAFECEPAAPG
jgi:hypothetical protein